MQRLADQKHRILHSIVRALAERELCLGKAARRIAYEVEDRDELAGRVLAGTFRRHAAGVPAGRAPYIKAPRCSEPARPAPAGGPNGSPAAHSTGCPRVGSAR